MGETSRYERQRGSKALQRADPAQVPTGPPTSPRAPPPDFLNLAPSTTCSARPRNPVRQLGAARHTDRPQCLDHRPCANCASSLRELCRRTDPIKPWQAESVELNGVMT